ncbi:MAG TPA: GNAT family N-acetyltransferase [Ignavibacteria bacterium]|nr:GNAT family N-acetyltransferase [Ignavibacteria bacterium]
MYPKEKINSASDGMSKEKINIIPLEQTDFKKAVEIYTEGFSKDPLHLYAFPDERERIRITKIIYEFMVFDLVPLMKLKITGAYLNDELAGVLIYTPLEHGDWCGELNRAVENMRSRAANENVKFIGEYSMEAMRHHPKEPHYYMNELSVSEKFRGRGIGSALLLGAEDEARKNPLVRFVLLDTTNPKNVSTYQKIGYEVRKTYPFHTLTSYSMWKKF